MARDLKYIVAAQHFGAANATAPVILELLKRGSDVVPLASVQAEEKYGKEWGFAYKTMENYGLTKDIQTISKEGLIKVLEMEQPDKVIVGSSTEIGTNGIEKAAMLACGDLGVPVLSVLDFCGDYNLRYKNIGTGDRINPNKIAVPDKYAFEAMKKNGFSEESLAITGNPTYEHFVANNSGLSGVERKRKRADLGFGNGFGVLYIGNAFKLEKGRHGYWDLDNVKIIANALKCLPSLNARIAITQHGRTPEEERDEIKAFLEQTSDDRIRYFENVIARNHLSSSDMVLTPFSTDGINAALIGKPVFSMQPNYREQRLITNDWGATYLIDSENKFCSVFEAVANNSEWIHELCPNLKSFAPKTGSVQRIIEECDNL